MKDELRKLGAMIILALLICVIAIMVYGKEVIVHP
jgi:hypothetical protein